MGLFVRKKKDDDTAIASGNEAPNPIGTLARGLTVLNAVIESPHPMMLAEIAALCGLDQSTTLRLLRSLEESSYVVRMRGSKRYLPSPHAMRPLSLMHPVEQFRRDASSILADLAEKTDQTAILALFIGNERMVIDIEQRPGSLSPYYDNWLKGPMHATGVGKALLASMTPESRKAILGPGPFPAFTAYTITDPETLEANLAMVDTLGYVYSRDEHHVGLTAVSALISSWSRTAIGCLTVTGHSSVLTDEKLAQVGEELVRCAQIIRYQTTTLRFLEHFSDRAVRE